MLTATLNTADAELRPWEFIVIGSGPAGAFAALRLAQAGRRVLVIEKKSFPRAKVCGGCVGADALSLLHNAGIGDDVAAVPQTSAAAVQLRAGRRTTRLRVRPLQVISREDLDACVIDAAVRAGSHFLPQTAAFVGTLQTRTRAVECRTTEGEFRLAAECVIAADGLSHSSLQRLPDFCDQVTPRSRVGLGTIIAEEPAWCAGAEIETGTVQMAIGREGYVGIARGPAGRLHLAAAVRPAALVRRAPADVIGDLLQSAGRADWADRARTTWKHAPWCGTPPLTHRLNRTSAERLVVLGDAASYVEPFTGEGIYWALYGADRLARAVEALPSSSLAELPHAWQASASFGLQQRTRNCRIVAALTRAPWPPAWSVAALNVWPWLSELLVRKLNAPLAVNGSQ